MAVEIPTWFEEKNYLNNKAVQLNATKFNDKTDWTADSALAAIEAAGMSAYEHFVAYGNVENISPNPMFNVAEYLAAKAAQLNTLTSQNPTGPRPTYWRHSTTPV